MPAQTPTVEQSSAFNLSLSQSPEKKVYDLATSKFDWLKDYLLPSSTVIILTISLFFLGSGIFTSISQRLPWSVNTLLNLPQLFEDQHSYSRFQKFISDSSNQGESSENFIKAFVYLQNEYSLRPSEEKRSALVFLSSYISLNYPEQSKSIELKTPCRQESCGAEVAEIEEITEIKSLLEVSNSLNRSEKGVILHDLEDFELAKGEDNEAFALNSLSLAFQQLRSAYEKNGEQNLLSVGNKILALIEETNPEFYGVGASRGVLTLNNL